MKIFFDLIVAMDLDSGIGKDGGLPWHLPVDLKHFKQLTTTVDAPSKKNAVVMGRKTWESLPEKFRPLPGRLNAVITRNKDLKINNCHVFTSIQEGIDFAKSTGEQELFIIGGGEIYRQTIDLADTLYITHIDREVLGDTHFPTIDPKKWHLASSNPHEGFSFAVYKRT